MTPVHLTHQNTNDIVDSFLLTSRRSFLIPTQLHGIFLTYFTNVATMGSISGFTAIFFRSLLKQQGYFVIFNKRRGFGYVS
jgi:hypothetical protein